jgi:hypothetical protein
MAISFIQPIQENKLRMAFNNDVIRFKSDSVLVPAFAVITGLTGIAPRLYPAPDGTFFINLMPYVSSLINTRSFNDTLQPDINGSNPNSFIYAFSDGTILQASVKFSITFADGTIESVTQSLTWLAAVQQIESYVLLDKTKTYALAPLKIGTADRNMIKYWQGYPFDIPFYSPGTSITIKNETNLLDATFTTPTPAFRLVLSNGDDDETLENILPLADGFNKLKIDSRQCEFVINKVPYKCGMYLKWINPMGGYSYWLFEETHSIDRSSKQLGELDRDINGLEYAFNRAAQIGKDSQDTIRIVAELLTDNERRTVETILDSPKIYLFTGQPYSRNDFRNWVEVTLKTTSARIKNAKRPITNFALDIELPQRYTQTL